MADEETEHAASETAKGAPGDPDQRHDRGVVDGEAASGFDPLPAASGKTAADLRGRAAPRPRGWAVRAFFAGVLGGLIVAAAALAGAYYLYPPKAELAEADANRLANIEARTQRAESDANRLAVIEAQAKEASAAAKDQAQRQSDAFSSLDKRMTALESSSSASGAAALAGRISALEAENTVRMAKIAAAEDVAKEAGAEVKGLHSDAEATARTVPALEARVAKLESAAPHTASSADVSALSGRVDKLEASVAAQTQALAGRAKAEDNVAAVGVVAEDLRDKLRSGASFGPDLAALDRLGVDPAKLEPLKVLVNGAPTGKALAASFAAVAPKVLAAAAPDDKSASPIDRFVAHLHGLVQVRDLTETPGNDPAALVSQIEAASSRDDFGAALAAYAKLPEPARKAAAAWAAQVNARQAAEAALQSIREAAMGRLVGGDKS